MHNRGDVDLLIGHKCVGALGVVGSPDAAIKSTDYMIMEMQMNIHLRYPRIQFSYTRMLLDVQIKQFCHRCWFIKETINKHCY